MVLSHLNILKQLLLKKWVQPKTISHVNRAKQLKVHVFSFACRIIKTFLLTTLLCHIGVTAHSGTQFEPRSDVYASYSSWLATFSVDLTPYEVQLKALQKEIVNVRKVITGLVNKQIDDRHSSVQRAHYAMLRNETIALVHSEISQFWHEYWHIEEAWSHLKTLVSESQAATSRDERSVIPVVGDILSSLFGLVTI